MAVPHPSADMAPVKLTELFKKKEKTEEVPKLEGPCEGGGNLGEAEEDVGVNLFKIYNIA